MEFFTIYTSINSTKGRINYFQAKYRTLNIPDDSQTFQLYYIFRESKERRMNFHHYNITGFLLLIFVFNASISNKGQLF